MTTKLFLTADAVAALLQFPSRQAFLVKRVWLERECDFPVPMPHSQRPLLWRYSAITAWIDRQGLASTEDPAPASRTRADRLLQKAATA